jgi:hypothetical protein
MAKKRIKIGLNENGIGQVLVNDADISDQVTSITFTAKAGCVPQIDITLRPESLEIKADAELTIAAGTRSSDVLLGSTLPPDGGDVA